MGHYDKAREAHEEELEKRVAKEAGVSVLEYRRLKKHQDKMERGRALLEKQLEEQELIKYYQEHRNEHRNA